MPTVQHEHGHELQAGLTESLLASFCCPKVGPGYVRILFIESPRNQTVAFCAACSKDCTPNKQQYPGRPSWRTKPPSPSDLSLLPPQRGPLQELPPQHLIANPPAENGFIKPCLRTSQMMPEGGLATSKVNGVIISKPKATNVGRSNKQPLKRAYTTEFDRDSIGDRCDADVIDLDDDETSFQTCDQQVRQHFSLY